MRTSSSLAPSVKAATSVNPSRLRSVATARTHVPVAGVDRHNVPPMSMNTPSARDHVRDARGSAQVRHRQGPQGTVAPESEGAPCLGRRTRQVPVARRLLGRGERAAGEPAGDVQPT